MKVFKKHPCIIITNIHTFKTTIAHKTIPFEIGVSIFFVTDRNVKNSSNYYYIIVQLKRKGVLFINTQRKSLKFLIHRKKNMCRLKKIKKEKILHKYFYAQRSQIIYHKHKL